MKVLHTVAEMMAQRENVAHPLGLVPTMGYIHEGHLSLVRRARRECATIIASIFVNPTQFGPQEDYATYPRDLERDLALLDGEGVDIVFHPTVEEVYPRGFDTFVEVGGLALRLEGEFRPGHFRGVATVVCKLFTLVRPDRAYFGQKDGQQALVIRRMSADLNLGVEVVVCPTVRERDGLALSSRNVHLDPKERQAALVLYRSLCRARKVWQAGERDANRIRREMKEIIESEPLAHPDYVSVADAETLEELEVVDRPALVSLAVRIGKTRLIDNVVLETQDEE